MSAPRNTQSSPSNAQSSPRNATSSPRDTQAHSRQSGHISSQSLRSTSTTSARNQGCTVSGTTTSGNPTTPRQPPRRAGQQIQSVSNPRSPSERPSQRIQSTGNTSSAYDQPLSSSPHHLFSTTSPPFDQTSNSAYEAQYTAFYDANPPQTNRRERRAEDESLSANAVYMINHRTGQPTLASAGHIDPRNITGFEESEDEGGDERDEGGRG